MARMRAAVLRAILSHGSRAGGTGAKLMTNMPPELLERVFLELVQEDTPPADDPLPEDAVDVRRSKSAI